MPDFIIQFWQAYGPVIVYLLIPIISGIVGWGTNVLAIHMTFYPLEFVGIKPPIGWQGIIPMKAGIMAGKSVDLMTESLIDIKEQFSRIDPERVAVEMENSLKKLSAEIIDDVARTEAPMIWKTTPKLVKRQIMNRITEDLPPVVEGFMTDIRDHIEDLFDLKQMVIKELTTDKELLNQIFLQVGDEEFAFIKRSGFYFGFFFGLIQMTVWYFFPIWWILPLAGVLVGYITNFLALKLIFEPLEEKRVGPYKLQGLFIKRQKEVSTEYAKMIAERILTTSKIFDTMITGPASDRMIEMIRKHVSKAIDEHAGLTKSFFTFTGGSGRVEEIKAFAAERFYAELPLSIRHTLGYAEEALDIENTIREKMIELPPADYVGVLRPAFQEDEWKLILTGAILGGIAGALQLFLF